MRLVVDVVTFGEGLLRLTPPSAGRLEGARSLEVWPGGAELNVAIGLARLGTPAAWVSVLPRTALGRTLAAHARAQGVDTSHVLWREEGRVGLYFAEVSASPRTSSVLYDRAGSAFSTLEPDELDWPTILAGSRAFHVTGITPALCQGAAKATADALVTARAAGCHTSYDVNLRRHLVEPEHARVQLESVAHSLDTVFCSLSDADLLWGQTPSPQPEGPDPFPQGSGPTEALQEHLTLSPQPQGSDPFPQGSDPAEVAEALLERLGVPRIVLTAYVDGTRVRVAAGHGSDRLEAPLAVPVDPIGGGDAFCAGFLHGLLGGSVRRGLELGEAAATLKGTIPGDAPLVGPEEVSALAGGGARTRVVR